MPTHFYLLIAVLASTHTNIPCILLKPHSWEWKVCIILIIGASIDAEPHQVAITSSARPVHSSHIMGQWKYNPCALLSKKRHIFEGIDRSLLSGDVTFELFFRMVLFCACIHGVVTLHIKKGFIT